MMAKTNSIREKSWYKWLVCITSTFIMFSSIGLTVSAFAIYLPFIQEQNGFSATQTNMLLTFRTILQLLGVLSISKFYKIFSYRVGAAIAMLVLFSGFALYGFAGSYPVYVIAAMLCGLGCGLSGTVGSLIITEWFTENRATAIGICSAGSGIASIVMPIAVTQLVTNFSLRTSFVAEACFVLLVGLAALIIVRRGPNAVQSTPKTEDSVAEKKKEKNFRIPMQHVVMMIAGLFLVGFAITGITGAMSQLLREDFSAETTSLLVTIFGITLFVGKIVYGRLADKIGLVKTNLISYICLTVGTLGMFLAHESIIFVAIWIAFMGFGCPLATVAMPLLANEASTPGRYVHTLKICSLFTSGGGLVVSYVTGALTDLTHSYAAVFLVLAATAAASAVLVELIAKKMLKAGK